MLKKPKTSNEKSLLDALYKEINMKPTGNFKYEDHIVKKPIKEEMFIPFKQFSIKNTTIKNNPKINQTQKITPNNNNKKLPTFNGIIGKQKKSVEILKSQLLNKKRELILKEKEPEKKMKKEMKKSIVNQKKKEKVPNFYCNALGITEEYFDKIYEEKKKKEKEEEEKKTLELNEILQRNLMGNKKREFITQNEEEKERLAKENEIKNIYKNNIPIDLSIPIPHINPIRRNNLEKYRNFHPMNNDIYKNVLSFDFYRNTHQTEEIPNTFENEAHYRYIWITNFFNELKFCLLNEKIEKSEFQNYENVDIKLNLLRLNDIDSKLIMLKINTNRKLNELKKRILKENDIIAVYNEKNNYNKNEITLQNEYNLNYFLGIVTRENDANELMLFVLRNDYENFIVNDIPRKEDDSIFDKTVRYLGSINSPLREYKALLDLQLSSFTGIIKTESIFLSSIKNENNNETINNFHTTDYSSKAERFLHYLKKSKIYNEPQKNAIYKANLMKKNDILLVQGPPGTGKTHTILGLISLFLQNKYNHKILVCAPSNAAIDEISARLAIKGVFNSDLKPTKCNFLRFGLFDRKDKEKKYLETLNGKLLEKYSLEYLSDQKYKKDIDNLSERLENFRRQLYNYNKDKTNNMGYIKNTEAEISNCLKLLSDKRYKKTMFEHDILTNTPILCTTLNNAGNERLKKVKISYEYLIIDEASQCAEPSCLIPLFHDVRKLILVGDHMQLPPTVFYPKAAKILYNRSLFERLIDNKYPRHILTVQYRMQSNISEFISKVFYDNKLTNDETHNDNINKEPIYSIINIKNNFSFFDISYGEEIFEEGKKSYYNESEIKFSFMLIKKLISSIENEIFKYQKNKKEQKGKNNILENNEKDKKETKETKEKTEKKEGENKSNFNDINTQKNKENDKEKDENDKKMDILKNYKFAIICAYKSQVLKFREMKKADKFFNNQIINEIEINTVDSFQGQERDIIIFSTVRANFKDDSVSSNLEDGEIPKTPEEKLNENNNNNIGIGFLNDFRRMNVGLSRAKVGCFVVGHFETLKNNSYWKKLINFCKDKKSFFKVEKSKESDSIRNILI